MTSQKGVRRLIGVSQIGIGMTMVADILLTYELVSFLLRTDRYPMLWLNLTAWLVLLTATIVAQVALWRVGDRVPEWSMAAWLAVLAVVAGLDIAGTWGMGPYPTAALACGAGLLVAASVRRAREIIYPSIVLGVALVVTIFAENRQDIRTVAPDIASIAIAVCPPLLGVLIVWRFRLLIQRELDLAQVQSTTAIEPLTVGMLASDQLVRLDLAAERLLQEVATGQHPLPLSPQRAAHAAALATQLRLHLIEGRRETWLYHAITESTFLRPSVKLVDVHGLAWRLDQDQRDGLLGAIWLLINDQPSADQVIHLQIGDDSLTASDARAIDRFPITISTTGVPRRKVDRSAWQALERVGVFTDSAKEGDFRVKIDCRVSDPAAKVQ